jgi:hypothetical protein
VIDGTSIPTLIQAVLPEILILILAVIVMAADFALKMEKRRFLGWITAGGLLAVAVISLILGLNGWEITRLWLYLLGSAMSILVGIQLIVNWVLMRILEELSHRPMQVEKDLIAV